MLEHGWPRGLPLVTVEIKPHTSPYSQWEERHPWTSGGPLLSAWQSPAIVFTTSDSA